MNQPATIALGLVIWTLVSIGLGPIVGKWIRTASQPNARLHRTQHNTSAQQSQGPLGPVHFGGNTDA